jgi:hypothetical protein
VVTHAKKSIRELRRGEGVSASQQQDCGPNG